MKNIGKILKIYDDSMLEKLSNNIETLCAIKLRRQFYRNGKCKDKVLCGTGTLDYEWRRKTLRNAIKKQLNITFKIRGKEYFVTSQASSNYYSSSKLRIQYIIINKTDKEDGCSRRTYINELLHTAYEKYNIKRDITIFEPYIDIVAITRAAMACTRLKIYKSWRRDYESKLTAEAKNRASADAAEARARATEASRLALQEKFNAALAANRRKNE